MKNAGEIFQGIPIMKRIPTGKEDEQNYWESESPYQARIRISRYILRALHFSHYYSVVSRGTFVHNDDNRSGIFNLIVCPSKKKKVRMRKIEIECLL